jgi:hypothetical protein
MFEKSLELKFYKYRSMRYAVSFFENLLINNLLDELIKSEIVCWSDVCFSTSLKLLYNELYFDINNSNSKLIHLINAQV